MSNAGKFKMDQLFVYTMKSKVKCPATTHITEWEQIVMRKRKHENKKTQTN